MQSFAAKGHFHKPSMQTKDRLSPPVALVSFSGLEKTTSNFDKVRALRINKEKRLNAVKYPIVKIEPEPWSERPESNTNTDPFTMMIKEMRSLDQYLNIQSDNGDEETFFSGR